jgi:hypothetical protein
VNATDITLNLIQRENITVLDARHHENNEQPRSRDATSYAQKWDKATNYGGQPTFRIGDREGRVVIIVNKGNLIQDHLKHPVMSSIQQQQAPEKSEGVLRDGSIGDIVPCKPAPQQLEQCK